MWFGSLISRSPHQHKDTLNMPGLTELFIVVSTFAIAGYFIWRFVRSFRK